MNTTQMNLNPAARHVAKATFYVSIALFSASCLGAMFTSAQAASTVEVVQSFPIETTLEVPGIAQTQQTWLDIVNSAMLTLDVEQYYINNVAGQSLDPVITAIKTAAGRGVQVRFILDSAFLKENPNEADSLRNTTGIDLRQIDFSPGIMHAKYMVADGINAYTGSANMDWLALSHIHEMGLHTVDAAIGAKLESIFNTDWPNATEISTMPQASTTGLNLSWIAGSLEKWLGFLDPGLPGITVVASPEKANPSGIPDTLDSVVSIMGQAKSSLQIQVYQYSTTPYSGTGAQWTPLDGAIRAAAARGVQVQIMVDATVMPANSKTELQALAKVKNIKVKLITIPEWSGGPLQYARLIHSKYFLVDGNAGWVGSENWIDSYFLDTRNAGIAIENATIAGQLSQVYQSVWNSSYGATL